MLYVLAIAIGFPVGMYLGIKAYYWWREMEQRALKWIP